VGIRGGWKWLEVAQGRAQLQSLVKAVLKLRVRVPHYAYKEKKRNTV
jgi:hypothetical protein